METKTKTREEEIVAAMSSLREELNQIKDRERRPRLEKFVGKCYTFQNSYGSGDHWPLYTRVARLDGSGLGCFTFQTDYRGKLTITPDDAAPVTYDGELFDGYTEITLDEWTAAFSEQMQAVSKKVEEPA